MLIAVIDCEETRVAVCAAEDLVLCILDSYMALASYTTVDSKIEWVSNSELPYSVRFIKDGRNYAGCIVFENPLMHRMYNWRIVALWEDTQDYE